MPVGTTGQIVQMGVGRRYTKLCCYKLCCV